MIVGPVLLLEMDWKAKDVAMPSKNSSLALPEGTGESFPVVGDGWAYK